LCAGLALCHLLGPEAEQRGEIYSASIDGLHAGKLYAEMEAIIVRVSDFGRRVNAQRFRKSVEVLEGDGEGSTFEALSADARKAQGLAPSLWIYDELAQVDDRELLDNLLEGMSKRKEALGIVISTQAHDDQHPLSQLIDDALAGADPSNYAHVIAAPEAADPFDDDVLRSVNPAWGKYLDLDDLRKSRERARRMPAFEPAFRNLRLNQRIDASEENRLFPRREWEKCEGPIDRDDLLGRTCYGALDLSAKHDLTSLTLVFPDDEAETGYDILPFFWTPEGALEKRRPRERDLFKQWIKEGYLQAVPGPVVRYSYMADQIGELRRLYDLKAIAYDRWRIDDFKVDMTDAGLDELPLQPFGQGFKDMSPAIEYFVELAMEARLRSAAHPVLRACVTSAIVVMDPAGSTKIDKDKSNRVAMARVDGAVTLAMALGLAKRFVEVPRLDIAAMIG
jgi:phage terminase large subunit-like protein